MARKLDFVAQNRMELMEDRLPYTVHKDQEVLHPKEMMNLFDGYQHLNFVKVVKSMILD